MIIKTQWTCDSNKHSMFFFIHKFPKFNYLEFIAWKTTRGLLITTPSATRTKSCLCFNSKKKTIKLFIVIQEESPFSNTITPTYLNFPRSLQILHQHSFYYSFTYNFLFSWPQLYRKECLPGFRAISCTRFSYKFLMTSIVLALFTQFQEVRRFLNS